jgi:hypothetical protein
LCDFVFWSIIIWKSKIFSRDFDFVFYLYIMWTWAVFLMQLQTVSIYSSSSPQNTTDHFLLVEIMALLQLCCVICM